MYVIVPNPGRESVKFGSIEDWSFYAVDLILDLGSIPRQDINRRCLGF